MPRIEQLRIKHLSFIQRLATSGTLAATAEHLSMTPSAASMMLKEIESLLGVSLFRRKGRGMSLTEQGSAILPRCRTILGELGAIRTSLEVVGPRLLRVGAFPHTSATVLPGMIRSLLGASPSWRVQLVDDRADRLAERLLVGEIDLLLGRLPASFATRPETGELVQRILYDNELAIVARRDHPLARHRSVSLEKLLHWPWVLPGVDSTTRVALIDAFLRAGLAPPNPGVEAPSYHYSLSLVAQSDALTCCARSAVEVGRQDVLVLPVQADIAVTRISLIWKRAGVVAIQAIDQLVRDGILAGPGR